MPEGLIPENPLVRQVKLAQREDKHVFGLIEELREQYPEVEYVGMGSNFIATVHPHDRTKVVVENYVTTEERNIYPLDPFEKYHLHRVLSILFPRHIPKWHAVRHDGRSLRVLSRVIEPEDCQVSLEEKDRVIDKITRALEELGVKIRLDQSGHKNFRRGADGKIFYVDEVNCSVKEWEKVSYDQLTSFYDRLRGRAGLEIGETDEELLQRNTDKDKRSLVRSLRRLKELSVLKSAYLGMLFGGVEYADESVQEHIRRAGLDGDSTQDLHSRRRIERSIARLSSHMAELLEQA